MVGALHQLGAPRGGTGLCGKTYQAAMPLCRELWQRPIAASRCTINLGWSTDADGRLGATTRGGLRPAAPAV